MAEKYTFYYLTVLGKNIYVFQSLVYPDMNKFKRKGDKKKNQTTTTPHQVSIVTSCRGYGPIFGQEIFEESEVFKTLVQFSGYCEDKEES